MKPSSIIRNTAYLVSGAWSIVTALAGFQFEDNSKRLLSVLPLILVGLFYIWDRWAWRWKVFLHASARPDLNGTWTGELRSEWLDADNNKHDSVTPALLYVRQNFTWLSLTLQTESSTSYSLNHSVEKLPSGDFRVHYNYANKPYVAHRARLLEHLGSAQLTVPSARGRQLDGEYWTNRMSRGGIKLTWRSSKRVNSFGAVSDL
ncbi:hypothetical protein LTI14_10605 [Nesterenkonia sp. YGD6]|uniref:Cap15 family cyclic dinucleotide receptor domain-containing protein n=1 Tax=Nesterenkonia sp. YGD6 TaxID=2901231 RepID=UPI001F4CD2D3|nr:hypothetical protein [Nesterenkonia sp. YGD6]MCH8563660.1 hypothetical protein [Nesterenkonia sp. YGD6]